MGGCAQAMEEASRQSSQTKRRETEPARRTEDVSSYVEADRLERQRADSDARKRAEQADQEQVNAVYRRAADEARKKAEASESSTLQFQFRQAYSGSSEYEYVIGKRFLEGNGVVANRDTAREWFEKASAQGHKKAAEALKNPPFAPARPSLVDSR